MTTAEKCGCYWRTCKSLDLRWKPQTHIIAYGEMTDPNYFTGRGKVDASLAKGILGLDVDSGETLELVKPQGFSLVNPKWSADGRFLSFDEVYLMEGRGNFAYYDFEKGEYHWLGTANRHIQLVAGRQQDPV